MSAIRLAKKSFLNLTILAFAALTGCSGGGTLDRISDVEKLAANSPLNDDSLTPAEQDSLSDFTDCDSRLPCVWSSRDTGITITLEAVGSDSITGRLEIAYIVQTTRDTRLQLLERASAVDSTGGNYIGLLPEHGSSNVVSGTNGAFELLAGIRLTVNQSFRQATPLSIRSVARFSFEFIENSMSHKVGFLNLPLGSATGDEIDCKGSVPCTWRADNEEYNVTVILAEGLTAGRLLVHYQVDAFEDVRMYVDTGSIAIGNEGTVFMPKIHTFGDTSDYRPFESVVFADASASGVQSYFRTADQSATRLKKLTLDLSQIGTPGGGVPVFTNLPLD